VSTTSSPQRGKWARRSALAIAILLAVAVGWWAARATFVSPVSVSEEETEQVFATAAETTVGQSITLNATVSQPFSLVASNLLSGIVTAVNRASALEVGDEAYSVDNRSVRVVKGSLPFYRDLTPSTEGRDVKQLQRGLTALDFDVERTGRFDSATTVAVRSWQKAIGDPVTGTIPLGTLVALPTLPGAIAIDEGIVPGVAVAGGEPAVLGVADEPSFALVVSTEQAATIAHGTLVRISFDDVEWDAVVSGTTVQETGTVALDLTAPDGGIVCGDDCDLLPPDESLSLLADVQLVPEVSGIGIPAAAVRTDVSGATYVIDESGESKPVSVVSSGSGMAIVEGIAAGERVIVTGGSLDDSR
jgi:peptidoglycan hydrolase-like protein with peptidoglycan-binding domain